MIAQDWVAEGCDERKHMGLSIRPSRPRNSEA